MTNQPSLDPQVRQAIDAAMENKWQEALHLNKGLLNKYPDDIDTINRLARSLTETGKISEAKRFYKRVLELDSYNQIAIKNLSRLSSIRKKDIKESQIFTSIKGDIFLEEPGRTKTTFLEDTAMPAILVGLRTGDNVEFATSKNTITILSKNGDRIGKLEDELGKRILQDIQIGSNFEALVRSVSLNKDTNKSIKPQVSLFIREVIRSPKVSVAPFPSQSSGFTPYVREEAMNLLSNQSPVPTEADDNIEEVEVSSLSRSEDNADSLEHLAEKEQEDEEEFD